ncbi:MAG: glycosyltransferase family 2 protein [Oscillospiraceae bacterium]
MDRLAIIVPCYNEEEVLPQTFEHLKALLEKLISCNKISDNSFVLFVDDGSRDDTWQIISKEQHCSPLVSGLKLAANSGHQNALVAGLMTALEISDITVSIDADLQDDETVIEEMVDKFHDGCDIVYGVRSSRKTDSFLKRTTAQGFYKFMKSMGAKSIYNHADFRLMSRRAVSDLAKFDERNLFLRGIVPLIGYKSDIVYYERSKRTAGESKYPLKKMISFAFDGITSFSIKPISIITGLGFLIIVLSILAFIYTMISYITGHAVAGWSSLILSIWFLGGVQLLSIGLVGQYIGKIYIEAKHRPRYIIEEFKAPKNNN